MTPMINASHLDVEVRAELTELQDARWRREDAAKTSKPTAKAAPSKSAAAPKPAAKTAAKKTPAPRAQPPPRRPSESAQPSPAPAPELPPGSVVISASEMEAVDLRSSTSPSTIRLSPHLGVTSYRPAGETY